MAVVPLLKGMLCSARWISFFVCAEPKDHTVRVFSDEANLMRATCIENELCLSEEEPWRCWGPLASGRGSPRRAPSPAGKSPRHSPRSP